MHRPISNPRNPWDTTHFEWLGEPPPARLEVFEEQARSILTANDSPDLPMRWSINPYRGCFHACAYCYARRSHQYLGFGAGTDFERKIVVKINAADRLRQQLRSERWDGSPVLISGNTDCYQPLEAVYGLTRACLCTFDEFDNPVVIITKGALVRRDLDVLIRLARRGRVQVFMSVAFASDVMARAVEPFAPSPTLRFETLHRLSDAGVPCGVSLAPCIPGLNESQIPQVLQRAKDAGARWAFLTLVRLSGEVASVFSDRLTEAFPKRSAKVLATIRQLRGGHLNETAFGARMKGVGPRWDVVARLFELHRRRLGLEDRPPTLPAARTSSHHALQGRLFDASPI